MDKKLNYPGLKVLAIGFTRSNGIFGTAIQFVRGGAKALKNKDFPNHAFLITSDHGQLFATEETPRGLVENSMEKYIKRTDRIVAMYRWVGWREDNTEAAERFLAEIRRRRGEESKYDFIGLLSFVPVFKWFVKPDPKKQWCSENVASIHQKFGCPIKNVHIAPDQLLAEVHSRIDFEKIDNYYLSA